MLATRKKIRILAYTLFMNLMLISVSASLLVVSTVQVQAAVINRVDVVGNSRMDVDTIASYLTIKPGKRYSNADVDESVKRLFATGLFRDVSISKRGSTLIVEVIENPTVNEVSSKVTND